MVYVADKYEVLYKLSPYHALLCAPVGMEVPSQDVTLDDALPQPAPPEGTAPAGSGDEASQ